MNYLDYESNGEDDCSVDDVEFEAEHYDDQDRDLPVVSDLEFIAANAAADSFEFIDTGANMMEQEILDVNDSDSDSEGNSEGESEAEVSGVQGAEVESSSESSDSEDEVISKKQYQKQSKQISWLAEEEGDEAATGPLKTKNELEEEIEVVEAKQLEIKDSAELVCIGEVKYRIDHECVVVIQADFTTNALNEGSVLCNIDGKVLGKIQEIFGPITTPFYTVRWRNPNTQSGNKNNTSKKANDKGTRGNKKYKKKPAKVENTAVEAGTEEVISEPLPDVVDAVGIEIEKDESLELKTEEVTMTETTAEPVAAGGAEVQSEDAVVSAPPKAAAGLEISDVRALFPVGAKLYTVQTHCSYVLAAQLQKARGAKGSDASNAYDEEPPEEELEFSDDEQEMAAKAARKQAKKSSSAQAQVDASFGDAIPSGRPGANKRGAGGFNKPSARPAGNYGPGQGQQLGVPQTHVPGFGAVPAQYSQMNPGYAPMNPTYVGGQYMQQQPFYGQQQPPAYPMHPYGAPNPGFPMQYPHAPHMYPQQGYAQQHMYPPQPQMAPHQYAGQPGFIPAAAFVPGAYGQQNQAGAPQPPMPQYQYQPLQFNNAPGAKK